MIVHTLKTGQQKNTIDVSGKCFLLEGQTSWGELPTQIRDIIDNTIKTINFKHIDKIYRYPNIDLSRDKMGFLKKKHNIKITRKKEEADLHVTSEKIISDLYVTRWGAYFIDKLSFLEVFEANHEVQMPDCMLEILNALKDTDGFLISSGYGFKKRLSNHHNNQEPSDLFIQALLDRCSTGDKRVHGGGLSYQVIDTNKLADYESLIANKSKVMLDVDLNEHTGSDSITIDKKQYASLETMLTSTDKDNSTLALSMMAHCNLAKSKTMLAFLFFHYGDLMKSMPGWNQVAFKTLRKRYSKYWHLSNSYHYNVPAKYENFVSLLIEDGAYTKEAEKNILDLVFDTAILQNNIGKTNSLFSLQRKDLKMNTKKLTQITSK